MSATRCGTSAFAISGRSVSSITWSPRNTVQTATAAGVADGEASTAAATVEAVVHRGADERKTAAPNPSAAPVLLRAAGGKIAAKGSSTASAAPSGSE